MSSVRTRSQSSAGFVGNDEYEDVYESGYTDGSRYTDGSATGYDSRYTDGSEYASRYIDPTTLGGGGGGGGGGGSESGSDEIRTLTGSADGLVPMYAVGPGSTVYKAHSAGIDDGAMSRWHIESSVLGPMDHVPTEDTPVYHFDELCTMSMNITAGRTVGQKGPAVQVHEMTDVMFAFVQALVQFVMSFGAFATNNYLTKRRIDMHIVHILSTTTPSMTTSGCFSLSPVAVVALLRQLDEIQYPYMTIVTDDGSSVLSVAAANGWSAVVGYILDTHTLDTFVPSWTCHRKIIQGVAASHSTEILGRFPADYRMAYAHEAMLSEQNPLLRAPVYRLPLRP